jgi:pilus assembly protein CpaE
MLRSILISPDQPLNKELATALADFPDVELMRVFPSYPSLDDLLRTIRVRKPDFLLLGIEEFSRAEALAAHLDDLMPGFPVVALGRHLEPDVITKLMHLGIRECLTSPIERANLDETVNSIQRRLKVHPFQTAGVADLYTFLPAKPGVGCSTIAVSASCALADDFGVRTLLIDADLAAGPVKFLLKLGNSSSIVDALGHAPNLDEDLWSQIVGNWEKLDVLHAGELTPPASIDLSSLQRVLSIARSQYEVICADLGSSLDPFSISFMRESRRIFLVTTPEIVPIHFAAERVRSLEKLGLADRIRLLVNRKSGRRGAFGDAEVARLVGLPITFSFSNDYPGVEKSILDGSPVSRDSGLGQSVLNLAHSLVPHVELKEPSKHRKFLEFFHVPSSVEETFEVHQD